MNTNCILSTIELHKSLYAKVEMSWQTSKVKLTHAVY